MSIKDKVKKTMEDSYIEVINAYGFGYKRPHEDGAAFFDPYSISVAGQIQGNGGWDNEHEDVGKRIVITNSIPIHDYFKIKSGAVGIIRTVSPEKVTIYDDLDSKSKHIWRSIYRAEFTFADFLIKEIDLDRDAFEFMP